MHTIQNALKKVFVWQIFRVTENASEVVNIENDILSNSAANQVKHSTSQRLFTFLFFFSSFFFFFFYEIIMKVLFARIVEFCFSAATSSNVHNSKANEAQLAKITRWFNRFIGICHLAFLSVVEKATVWNVKTYMQ